MQIKPQKMRCRIANEVIKYLEQTENQKSTLGLISNINVSL